MKINNLIIYLNSSYLKYNYNNQEGIEEFKSITDGNIINLELFKKEFTKFIKKKNINSNILGDNLYYINIKNSYLENIKLKEIFNQYGFKNIHNIEVNEILDPSNTYAIINKKEIIIYTIKKIFISPIISFQSIKENLYSLINNKDIEKSIYIFNNENKELYQYLKNNNIELYSIYNPKDYLIDKLLKKVTNM